jgi:hypothetical protein
LEQERRFEPLENEFADVKQRYERMAEFMAAYASDLRSAPPTPENVERLVKQGMARVAFPTDHDRVRRTADGNPMIEVVIQYEAFRAAGEHMKLPGLLLHLHLRPGTDTRNLNAIKPSDLSRRDNAASIKMAWQRFDKNGKDDRPVERVTYGADFALRMVREAAKREAATSRPS